MYEKVGSEYEMFYRYDNDGRLSMVTCRDMTTGQKYYYNVVTNAQGDVVNLLGGSGAVRVTYTYDAYGRLVSMTDSTAGAIAIGSKNSIRYRGYVYDSETEMYYLQSRYYDPETGRFINCDAPDYIGVSDTFNSWNGFAYCENDPVNMIDCEGYSPIQVVFATMGAIAGWYLGHYVANWFGFRSGWKYWAIRTGVVVGGAVLGWFAGGALASVIKAFIFSKPELIASTPLWIYKFLGIITGSGSTVLGSYPTYLSLAKRLGSNVFSVADDLWENMTYAAQWATNQAFLNKAIQAGHKFILATNAYKAKPGTFFYKEIHYLLEHGYKIVENGWAMVKK